jgi:hypothetical protein
LKTILLNLVIGALLLGCVSCASFKHVSMPPIVSADMIEVLNNQDQPMPVGNMGDITSKEQIGKMMDFVNSLPSHWRARQNGYGPPIVTFAFYENGKFVGILYVSHKFFGRVVLYGNGHDRFYTETATDDQIQELNAIAGFDVGKHVQAL